MHHVCFLQQDTSDLPANSVRALTNWDESFSYCDGCSPDALALHAAVGQQPNGTPPVAPQPPTPAPAIASTTASAKASAQVQRAPTTVVSSRAQRAQQRRAKSPKNKNKGRTHAHHNNSSKTNDPAKPDEDPTHPPAEQQAGQRKTRQKPTAQGTPPQGVTFPFNAHDG
jgi:hypothetical protein